jgi:hypothetical protein
MVQAHPMADFMCCCFPEIEPFSSTTRERRIKHNSAIIPRSTLITRWESGIAQQSPIGLEAHTVEVQRVWSALAVGFLQFILLNAVGLNVTEESCVRDVVDGFESESEARAGEVGVEYIDLPGDLGQTLNNVSVYSSKRKPKAHTEHCLQPMCRSS